jgi:uncharacterized membrane protein YqiK
VDPGVASAAIAGASLLVLVGLAFTLAKTYRRIAPSEVLVVSTSRGTVVRRGGAVVFPIIHSAQAIDMSVRVLRVERRAPRVVMTDDAVPLEVAVAFSVRVNDTEEDILKVARDLGSRAADPAALRELFEPRFSSALDAVIARERHGEIATRRAEIEDRIMEVVGCDLHGFRIESVAIEQIAASDPVNAGPFR